ncbi:uncharacterized protein LOC112349694 [Selaginella moellendorffii]|uniref:uncharacterized protein LOC112349694 n=1 Tax=Selaginella moellendorffii TaxID=88036 RepID=UPI000D1C5B8F|nr:uncharacterized protein LOC112349694 [Selaginella moellendorffii]|eukprot:XP_024540355.1 uncharacterized protein LOC112349694 [Selaginella moellendorffii]
MQKKIWNPSDCPRGRMRPEIWRIHARILESSYWPNRYLSNMIASEAFPAQNRPSHFRLWTIAVRGQSRRDQLHELPQGGDGSCPRKPIVKDSGTLEISHQLQKRELGRARPQVEFHLASVQSLPAQPTDDFDPKNSVASMRKNGRAFAPHLHVPVDHAENLRYDCGKT